MSAAMRRGLRAALIVAALLAMLAALVAWLNVRGEEALPPPGEKNSQAATDPAAIVRGAYLARAGNCAGCHTAPGGAEYAGGRGIDTPFGTVYASNLTPDADTGLGAWTAAEFRRALRHGRSRDGRLLYPAFPYPSYSRLTREDADALFAFLQSRGPVHQSNKAHELRFPYRLQASLAVWRALYFRPESVEPDRRQTAEWNRGRYLVQGLGHCEACHAPRNWLGATEAGSALGGALVPMQNWYAPALAAPRAPGAADWSTDDFVALLGTGLSRRGAAMGPMAEVVARSTQHLSDADLRAMASYLQSLPRPDVKFEPAEPASGEQLRLGAQLYKNQCAACHGEQGEGVAGIYPALAGNRAATMASPVNLVKAILHGGFPPATRGNPRPFGMPPFKQTLSEGEVAAVATWVRQSWGHQAAAVSELDVLRSR